MNERSGTPITDAFREWLKKATTEEKQEFVDAGNSLATGLQVAQKTNKLACSHCGEEITHSYQVGRCYNDQSEPDEMDMHDEAEPWEDVHGEPTDNTGNIMFFTADTSQAVMTFHANGDIFIRGEKVDSNMEVYQEATKFFRTINEGTVKIEQERDELARELFALRAEIEANYTGHSRSIDWEKRAKQYTARCVELQEALQMAKYLTDDEPEVDFGSGPECEYCYVKDVEGDYFKHLPSCEWWSFHQKLAAINKPKEKP